MSVCQRLSVNPRSTQMGNVAQSYLLRRVIEANQRVEIRDEMIRSDPRALRGLKETQLTRIANLAIRELLTLTRYK